MVRVFIPASLRDMCDGQREVELTATNVREAIQKLDSKFPGMARRLIDEDALKPDLVVAIDSEIREGGLLEQLTENCELHFVPAVSGG